MPATRACFLDDAEGDASCVFDTGSTDDCDEGQQLAAKGLCKKDCPYWRTHAGVSDERKRLVEQPHVRQLLRDDARQLREERTVSQFKLDMERATHAPAFKGNFGHGSYYRSGS